MDRVYKSGALLTPPDPPAAPSVGYPTGKDAQQGTAPTDAGAYWFHMITESLVRVIEARGLAPDHLNLNLLKDAIDLMVQNRKPYAITNVTAGNVVRLCSITFTDTDARLTARLRISDSTGTSDLFISAEQDFELPNNPTLRLYVDNVHGGYLLANNCGAFFSEVSAQQTVIDVYMLQDTGTVAGEFRAEIIEQTVHASIEFFGQEDLTTEADVTGGAGWDVISQARPGSTWTFGNSFNNVAAGGTATTGFTHNLGTENFSLIIKGRGSVAAAEWQAGYKWSNNNNIVAAGVAGDAPTNVEPSAPAAGSLSVTVRNTHNAVQTISVTAVAIVH